MKMHVGTEWSDRPRTVPVINPFDDSQIDTVPRATLTTWALPSPLPHGGPKR